MAHYGIRRVLFAAGLVALALLWATYARAATCLDRPTGWETALRACFENPSGVTFNTLVRENAHGGGTVRTYWDRTASDGSGFHEPWFSVNEEAVFITEGDHELNPSSAGSTGIRLEVHPERPDVWRLAIEYDGQPAPMVGFLEYSYPPPWRSAPWLFVPDLGGDALQNYAPEPWLEIGIGTPLIASEIPTLPFWGTPALAVLLAGASFSIIRNRRARRAALVALLMLNVGWGACGVPAGGSGGVDAGGSGGSSGGGGGSGGDSGSGEGEGNGDTTGGRGGGALGMPVGSFCPIHPVSADTHNPPAGLQGDCGAPPP